MLLLFVRIVYTVAPATPPPTTPATPTLPATTATSLKKSSWALFPFGHGLAYTRFAFDALALETDTLAPDGALRLSFTVRNTGTRPGVAVPQIYIQGFHKSVLRPLKELKAFTRVELAPGEEKSVRVEIPAELLAFHGSENTLNVEPGPYEVMLGSSAADIHAKQFFTVTAARPVGLRSVFGSRVAVNSTSP